MYCFDKSSAIKAKSEGDNNGEKFKIFWHYNLMSKFEFCKRRDLWTNTSQFGYVSASALGKIGMARKIFDILW